MVSHLNCHVAEFKSLLDFVDLSLYSDITNCQVGSIREPLYSYTNASNFSVLHMDTTVVLENAEISTEQLLLFFLLSQMRATT